VIVSVCFNVVVWVQVNVVLTPGLTFSETREPCLFPCCSPGLCHSPRPCLDRFPFLHPRPRPRLDTCPRPSSRHSLASAEKQNRGNRALLTRGKRAQCLLSFLERELAIDFIELGLAGVGRRLVRRAQERGRRAPRRLLPVLRCRTAGSYSRLIDVCVTQLKARNSEEEEGQRWYISWVLLNFGTCQQCRLQICSAVSAHTSAALMQMRVRRCRSCTRRCVSRHRQISLF